MFTLYCFFENKVRFHPCMAIILVNKKTTTPSGLTSVPCTRYIYYNTSCLGIYPPLALAYTQPQQIAIYCFSRALIGSLKSDYPGYSLISHWEKHDGITRFLKGVSELKQKF